MNVIGKCRIRPDLLESGLSVPVGELYVESSEYFNYTWDEDDNFFIQLKDGTWGDAESLDWDFCLTGEVNSMDKNSITLDYFPISPDWHHPSDFSGIQMPFDTLDKAINKMDSIIESECCFFAGTPNDGSVIRVTHSFYRNSFMTVIVMDEIAQFYVRITINTNTYNPTVAPSKYRLFVSDEETSGHLYDTYEDAVQVMDVRTESTIHTLTSGGASLMSDPDNWNIDVVESHNKRTVLLNDQIFKVISIVAVNNYTIVEEVKMGNLGQHMERDEVTQNLSKVTHENVVAYALNILMDTIEQGDEQEMFADFYQYVTGDSVPDSVDLDESLIAWMTVLINQAISNN